MYTHCITINIDRVFESIGQVPICIKIQMLACVMPEKTIQNRDLIRYEWRRTGLQILKL